MIKKGEYVKAFKCYSNSLYIFRLEDMNEDGVWFKLNNTDRLHFPWQFVTKLTISELTALGLEA